MSTVTRTSARIPSIQAAAMSSVRRVIPANTSGRVQRVAWLTGAVAMTSLLAACSSSPSQPAPVTTVTQTVTATPSAPAQPTQPTTQPSTPQAPATTPAPSPTTSAPATATGGGLAACRTAALRITINVTEGNAGAGSAYYPLNFTNTSGTACEMYGFPGVSFAAAPTSSGEQIGAAAQRSAGFSAVAVRLAAGQTAHAWLRVANAGNYPTATCKPVTANYLRVYPPSETVAGYVSHTFNACESTSAALLSVLPIRAGQGAAGVTP
jgi:hypothetical protein